MEPTEIENESMESFVLNTSNYGFSATALDSLGATEYTLVTIAVDISSSVYRFRDELVVCLKAIIEACKKSPRADNLLVRTIMFNKLIGEMHGFKLLTDCSLDVYDSLTVGGTTALFDATVNALEAIKDYGNNLYSEDFEVNGISIIITDGWDNESTNTPNQAKEIIDDIKKQEKMESLLSILIGVNVREPDIKKCLSDFETQAAFDKYVEIENADRSTLAKLAQFISKSISSQSQSLGTGKKSVPLMF